MHDNHEHTGDGCCEESEPITLLKRQLGKTKVQLSVFGFGARGLMKSTGRDVEASIMIRSALDLGVNFFDASRSNGASETYYGRALQGRRDDVFLSSKTGARDRAGAEADLKKSLSVLETDFLDLWQLEDVRTAKDVDAIFGPGGAIEALVEAKKNGTVRFIGVHGQHDPMVIKRCLETFEFDTVMIPVNPADPSEDSFVEVVVPVASAQDMGIIGIDVMLDGMLNAPARLLVSYALTQPVATVAIGCDDLKQLKENVEAAGTMQVLTQKEVVRLREFVAKFAGDIM
ncbi:MAG: aldo/keto reductase [Proteobacteria bacterium]|nr:aldo/keto reductase [Pseudomonadota bacterium]